LDLLVGGSRLKPKPFIGDSQLLHSKVKIAHSLILVYSILDTWKGVNFFKVQMLEPEVLVLIFCYLRVGVGLGVILQSYSKVLRNKDVMVEYDNISCRINE